MMSGAGTWGGQIREVPELAGRLPKVKIPDIGVTRKSLTTQGTKEREGHKQQTMRFSPPIGFGVYPALLHRPLGIEQAISNPHMLRRWACGRQARPIALQCVS